MQEYMFEHLAVHNDYSMPLPVGKVNRDTYASSLNLDYIND